MNPVNILLVDDQPAKLLSYEAFSKSSKKTSSRRNPLAKLSNIYCAPKSR